MNTKKKQSHDSKKFTKKVYTYRERLKDVIYRHSANCKSSHVKTYKKIQFFE